MRLELVETFTFPSLIEDEETPLRLCETARSVCPYERPDEETSQLPNEGTIPVPTCFDK